MNEEKHFDLKAEFGKKNPWITKFQIGGESYDDYFDARINEFRRG